MAERSNTSASPRPRGRPRLENNEQFERRREEIVDIAAEVFAERGFHVTTVDNLVEATGLQRGGLYHYMDSKEDLLIRIHERFISRPLAEAAKVADASDPPEVALRKLGHVLIQDIAGYLPQVTGFLHEWRIIEHDERWAIDPQIAEKIRAADLRRAGARVESRASRGRSTSASPPSPSSACSITATSGTSREAASAPTKSRISSATSSSAASLADVAELAIAELALQHLARRVPRERVDEA